MTTKLLVTVYTALTALLMSGCAGKVRYPNYYTLAVARLRSPCSTMPISLQPWPSGVSTLLLTYARDESSTRETPAEVGFYDYHRRASDPGAVVTAGVIDSLRSANLFSQVEPYAGQERPDHLLSGRFGAPRRSGLQRQCSGRG